MLSLYSLFFSGKLGQSANRFLRLFARFGTGASPALKSKWLNFGHLDFKVLTRRFLRLIVPLENLLKDSVCPQ